MENITRIINAVNRRVGDWASYLIIPMCLVVIYEVICRKLLNSPTSWAFDMTVYIFGAHFMLGMGYVELYDRHVRIDIVVQQFTQRLQLWLRIITFVTFFFIFVGSLTWSGFELALESWRTWEHGQSAWRPPIYPVKTLLPLGALLLLAQGFSNFIKDIKNLS